MKPSPSSISSPLSSPIVLDPLLLPPPALADEYTIPPPPNLKRKIIQVSPGAAGSANSTKKPRILRPKPTPVAISPTANVSLNSTINANAINEEKLKISEKRKHARKTAHSEIERRRRSKINLQFDALKELVPACHSNNNNNGNGNNGLHKLVILQATVEYIRYLKDCLEIKTNHQQKQQFRQQQQVVTPPQSKGPQPVSTSTSSYESNIIIGSSSTNVFPPSPNLQEPSPRIRVSDLIS